MKLKKHLPSKRNVIVLSLLGALFASATIIFVWFSVQNTAFTKQFTAYRDDVRKVLTEAKTTFKTLKDTNDVSGRQKALVALAASLRAKKAPQPPAILGVSLGADNIRAQSARLGVATKSYADDLDKTTAYVDYQQQVVVKLQLLSLKSAANYDQLVALAEAWQQTTTSISAIAPPAELKEVAATLVQKASAMQPIIVSLADLYKKNDEAGFIAKQAELTAAAAAFKPIGEQLAGIAAGIDATAATNLANIYKNL